MAKKLKVGDVIRGYRITKVFGPGMMAISYAAQTPGGGKVFFKQYKSPAPSVVWYEPFVAYQRELSARVRNGKAAHFAVGQVDAFEETWGGPCYFQAYEFVENGDDLQKILDEEREHHRKTRLPPTTDPFRLGTSCHLGESFHVGHRSIASIQNCPCRSQARQCLSDQGPVDHSRISTKAY